MKKSVDDVTKRWGGTFKVSFEEDWKNVFKKLKKKKIKLAHRTMYGENITVIEKKLKKEQKNEFHPTQKPIELPERAIKNSAPKGGKVVDLFGGSGSTLIACEKTNRKCFMMELDPHYVDVIIARYKKFTNKPVFLLKDDGTQEEVL